QHDPAPRREVADVRDWMLAEAADCDTAMRAHDPTSA
ncbi:LysR family transcriptional regulator, partial [Burkholderia sp. Ac-20392]|nr:LysR family transcriptional regulator [Burkholderia sp. Ac-20392]